MTKSNKPPTQSLLLVVTAISFSLAIFMVYLLITIKIRQMDNIDGEKVTSMGMTDADINRAKNKLEERKADPSTFRPENA